MSCDPEGRTKHRHLFAVRMGCDTFMLRLCLRRHRFHFSFFVVFFFSKFSIFSFFIYFSFPFPSPPRPSPRATREHRVSYKNLNFKARFWVRKEEERKRKKKEEKRTRQQKQVPSTIARTVACVETPHSDVDGYTCQALDLSDRRCDIQRVTNAACGCEVRLTTIRPTWGSSTQKHGVTILAKGRLQCNVGKEQLVHW